MNPNTRKTSASSFAGRGAGQDTSAFDSALHSVYAKACGKSTDDHTQWVTSPRTKQRVGIIVRELGLLVFQRLVPENGQRLRMFGGAWALETNLLSHVEQLGATWLRIITTDTGRMLHAPLRAFRENGKTITSPKYGTQLALPERFFYDCIIADLDKEPEPAAIARKTAVPELQPSLFGGA